MSNWLYITLDEALFLHQKELVRFGGANGVRDLGLLVSALVQAELKLFGKLVYKEAYEVAAVYAFHIIKNHPFVDGNKRTGILIALTFLAINGYRLMVTHDELYQLVIDKAASDMTKDDVVAFFKITCFKKANRLKS